MATTITARTRTNPKAMTGYRIIAGITDFSVEDGLGSSTEKENTSKIYIIIDKIEGGGKAGMCTSLP